MGKSFFTTLLLLLCVQLFSAQLIFAATLNFQSSRNYILKNEAVDFTFTYDIGAEDPPDLLVIEFNYNDDKTIDYIIEIDSFEEKKIERTYTMTFDKPGYFEATALFRITRTDDEGDSSTDTKTMGPLKINVANWKFTAEESLGCIESTPAISIDGSTIYLGNENGYLYAVDREDGTEKWRFYAGDAINSSPAVGGADAADGGSADTGDGNAGDGNDGAGNDGAGNDGADDAGADDADADDADTWVSDAGGDEKIYFGCQNGNFYCLNANNTLAWQYTTEAGIVSSPALDQENKRVYFGSSDFNLYALDSETGELIWKFKTNGKIVSSPVIGTDDTLYVGSLDNYLYAIDISESAFESQDSGVEPGSGVESGSGTESTHGFEQEREKWKFNAESDICGSPALDKDGTIFFGTASFRGAMDEKNGLYALSTTGVKKWYVQHASGFAAAPVIGPEGSVCIGSYSNKLYGIDRSGGNLLNYKQFSNDLVASPAIGSDDLIFAGSKDGMFYGLSLYKGDERSGRNEIWNYDMKMAVTTASPVIKDGFIYVGTCEYSHGVLFSFLCDPDPDKSDVEPSPDSPWPLSRNRSDNSGKTQFSSFEANSSNSPFLAPEICSTDPERGETEMDTGIREITVIFSKPMELASLYEPPGPDNNEEGYYGFIVEPFDSPLEDFTIEPAPWDKTLKTYILKLPDNESFKPYINYTASILSRAHAVGMDEDSNRSILYNYTWTFTDNKEEEHKNSYSPSTSSGCFISSLGDVPRILTLDWISQFFLLFQDSSQETKHELGI